MKKIDIKKIRKIEDILKRNPSGLWVREIARKTKLDKSTVSNYLNKHMNSKIRIIKMGGIKLIQLK
jgi:DNA invertase Pin-like site-specific DNA recombinase|tara:strand:- start:1236 stop:1433 length:198 start_codon:yes stop_codon:yes gene_type:complete